MIERLHSMDVLTWIPSKKVFLKVQAGTGDNLSCEDSGRGFVSYALWSTFRPEDIGLDEQFDMECKDGGMVLFKTALPQAKDAFVATAIPEAYVAAFGTPYFEGAATVLLTSEDYEESAR